MSRSHFVFLQICLHVLFAASVRAQVTGSHSVSFYFNQTARESGGFDYSLLASHFALYGVNSELRLTAPDGTVFSGIDTEVYRDSFAEIGEMAFGQWTVYEKFEDESELTYNVTVFPFDLSEVDTRYPVISTPANGAVVPQQFDVKWSLNDGTLPKSSAARTHWSPNLTYNPPPPTYIDGCCSRAIQVSLTGSTPGYFEITTRQSSELLEPWITGAPRSSTNSFRADAHFWSKSVLTRFTVVPEPTCCIMLAGMTLMASRFRRR